MGFKVPSWPNPFHGSKQSSSDKALRCFRKNKFNFTTYTYKTIVETNVLKFVFFLRHLRKRKKKQKIVRQYALRFGSDQKTVTVRTSVLSLEQFYGSRQEDSLVPSKSFFRTTLLTKSAVRK